MSSTVPSPLPGGSFDPRTLVEYAPGAIVSRVIAKTPHGNVTLFAFDAGQELSEHTTPFHALVQILDGAARIAIGGVAHDVAAGSAIMMPAGIPHAVAAPVRFMMLLTMLKD